MVPRDGTVGLPTPDWDYWRFEVDPEESTLWGSEALEATLSEAVLRFTSWRQAVILEFGGYKEHGHNYAVGKNNKTISTIERWLQSH